MSEVQPKLTLHVYHCMAEITQNILLSKNICNPEVSGTDAVQDCSMRFEFQGRGTLHVHVVAWVHYHPNVGDRSLLSGTTGQGDKSKLLKYLEAVFRSKIGVQCAAGEHCLLQYVTGFATNASDPLRFGPQDHSRERNSNWRQVYRMFCSEAPLAQEIMMEFAGKPMIVSSFVDDFLFAPVPGSKADNKSRDKYNAYLEYWKRIEDRDEKLISFLEWIRMPDSTFPKSEMGKLSCMRSKSVASEAVVQTRTTKQSA